MAEDVTEWIKVYLRIEDPDNPGTYLRPCVFTSQSIDFNNELGSINLPTCPPSATGESWQRQRVTVKSVSISADGFLFSGASRAVIRDWYLDAGSKRTCQWYVDLPAADGGGFWEGDFVLSNWNEGSGQDDNEGYVSMSISAESDGEVTWSSFV